MPTINPRVQVTLSPSLDALVIRFARLQRSSKSQVLRELLEAAEPGLQRVVALMEAASKAAGNVHSGLSASLQRSQEAAEDALAITLSRMDRATDDLVSQAEAVRGRRPARRPQRGASASSAAKNPPSSNRGVKSTKQPTSPPIPVTRKRGAK